MFRPLLTALALLVLASSWAAVPAHADGAADAWFETLQRQYDRHEVDVHPWLLTEIRHFEAAHPDDPRLPALWFLRGNILGEKKEHRAMMAWLKVMVLAPDFDRYAGARDGVLRVVTEKGKYEDEAADFRIALAELPAPGSEADRHFHYLELLRPLLHGDLYEPFGEECAGFCARYPADRRCDRAQLWQAEAWAADGDEEGAVAALGKTAAMYPGSELRPDLMYRRGLLLFEDLKQPQEAARIFTELNESYPDHPLGALALYDRGRVHEKEKEYEAAAGDWQAFADRYAGHDRVLEVLYELSELTYSKLKAYERTDAIYEDIVTRFAGDERALPALESSAKLNRSKLENYARSAAQYARAAELFPQADDAPDLVLDGAEVAEDKLDDLGLAIRYWEIVQTTWPDTEEARKAAGKIEKAREKLADRK